MDNYEPPEEDFDYDGFLDHEKNKRARARNRFVLYFLGFVVNFDQFIILPSAWFFVDSLGGSEAFFGWVLSSFSIAELFSSFLFGALSDRLPLKKCLIPMLLCMATGNFIYAFAVDKWMLIVGRALAGIGAGIVGIALGHIAKTTTMKERTDSISMFWLISILAMMCAPGIGAGISAIHSFENGIPMGHFNLNSMTVPAYLTGIICVISVFLVVFFIKPAANPNDDYPGDEYDTSRVPKLPIVLLIFVNFALTFGLSAYETLVTPMTSVIFKWGVGSNALLFLAIGGIVFFTIMIAGGISRLTQERTLVLLGEVIMFTGLLIGSNLIPSVFPIEKKSVFISSAVLITFGFSLNSAIVPSLITKYIESEKHGMIMGFFSGFTSLAQILGPLWAGATVRSPTEEKVTVIGLACITGIAIIATLALFLKLYPEKYYRSSTQGARQLESLFARPR